MAPPAAAAAASNLDEALARIAALIDALQSGSLIGSGPAPAAAPVKPAAAAKPAAVPATAAAAGKQAKKGKAKKAAPAAAAAADTGDAFDKAQLTVGRVVSVDDHPSGSEKLWLCKVDVGGGQQRQVVAGLRQHISREDLTGRLAALVLNLKPAKLAGELSEAMILAADHQPEGGEVLVRVLSVPASCQPGDAIFRQGGSGAPTEFPKEVKSKVWKEVVEGLAVQGGLAAFKGAPLATAAGPLTADGMPDGAGIH